MPGSDAARVVEICRLQHADTQCEKVNIEYRSSAHCNAFVVRTAVPDSPWTEGLPESLACINENV